MSKTMRFDSLTKERTLLEARVLEINKELSKIALDFTEELLYSASTETTKDNEIGC
jgi:hypothetical protein